MALDSHRQPIAVAPAKCSVFFYPSRPNDFHLMERLRQYAGWDLASSPEAADWCMLYQDDTWVSLPDDDPWAADAATWINGRCRDISKRKVERVFAETFGYSLAIDPLTYQGLCLRKGNNNHAHNGVVLTCPIPSDEIDDQCVYERLVDSRVPGLGAIELRTTVVGGRVIQVSKKICADWISTGRFADVALDIAIVYPSSVFSQHEMEQIAIFCRAMGLDIAGLDIIRDKQDGRIYILDANKTPAYPHSIPSATLDLVRLEHVAHAFTEFYPSGSATSAATLLTVTPSSSQASLDVVTNLVDRVAMQSERIARLETKVSTLGAANARLCALFRAAAVKKKRKK